MQSVFYSNRCAFKGTCHIYFHTGERRLWQTPEWRTVQKISLLIIKITHKNWLILLFCFQEFEASIGNSSSAWQEFDLFPLSIYSHQKHWILIIKIILPMMDKFVTIYKFIEVKILVKIIQPVMKICVVSQNFWF